MKSIASKLLSTLVLLFFTVSAASAQAPPGWGWVNKVGTYVPNSMSPNAVAGLGRDAAGNLYLLGTYVGTPLLGGMATTNAGETDMFLAKYSPAGALLWLRLLQSADVDQATALTVEPSGRCTLAGFFGGGPTGDNLRFAGFGTVPGLGGPALLGLPRVGVRNEYGSIMFLATVDASGALLWADVVSPSYGTAITALHRDALGNCYASVATGLRNALVVNGQNYPPIGINDAVLIKYTAAGQPAWVRRVGVVGGSGYGGEVYTDAANAVYWMVGHSGTITIDQVTVGVSSSTGAMSLVKLSAANRVRWIKNDLLRVGVNNVVSQLLGLDAATNALYLSCGSTGGAVAYTGSGSPVAVTPNAYTTCIARCDTAGQVQWVKPVSYATNVPGGLNGPRGASTRGFAVRGNGFTYVTSTVEYNATTFYGSARTYGLAEGGLPCVVHFNVSSNQAEWVRVGGTPSLLGQNPNSYPVAAAIDAADNVYVAGNFMGTAQFGTVTVASTSATQQEIFLAKLDQSVLTGTRAAAGQAWEVFPNPTTGAVQLTGLPAQARVRAYDAQGRAVRELTLTGAPATLAGLAPGLYLLQVSNTARPYRPQRLIVR